jgi:hypothetical protein
MKRTPYRMDYIPDKQLFAAVMWAREQIREGQAPGIAIYKAANYYGYSTEDVAHYVGQEASRKRHRYNSKNRYDDDFCF